MELVGSHTLAFVEVNGGPAGSSYEARRRVRVQAAKASAAARKRTIARRLARKKSTSTDEDWDPSQHPSETRRFSLPFARTAIPESAVSSPSASVSSSPTLSLRRTGSWSISEYPTNLQHAEIPDVVEYFLAYFAPASDKSADLRGRESLREQLWLNALGNQTLFHSCLLVAGSHAYATSAIYVPMDLLSQAKHAAIAGINAAVSRSLPDDPVEEAVITAIALLGGWELEYGDAAVYDTHMRGLQTIVQLRGGLFIGSASGRFDEVGSSIGLTPLSSTTVTSILSIAHNLPIYANRGPYFVDPNSHIPLLPSPLPARLPGGLKALEDQHLLHSSLIMLIGMLEELDLSRAGAAARLQDIHQALLGWDIGRTHSTFFSPLQTDLEDRMNGYAHQLMRLAGLAICGRVRLAVDSSRSLMDAPLQPLYAETLRVEAEKLVGTVYEEMALWALLVICAATTTHCEVRHLRLLRRLQLDQHVHEWIALQTQLARFAYPCCAFLDARLHPLWEKVLLCAAPSVVAADAAFELAEPTRYAKGIPHPTLHIGAAIAANEMAHRIEVPLLDTLTS